MAANVPETQEDYMARCKFGKVKTGARKGQCRTRRLSGAAKKSSRKRSSKKRRSMGGLGSVRRPAKIKARAKSRKGGRAKRTTGLSGLGASFIAELRGEQFTCRKLGRGASGEIRCKAEGAGASRGGPRSMSIARKKKAGVKRPRLSAQPKATQRVSRARATVKSGAKKGKPRVGCRFTKTGAMCRPGAAAAR